MDVDSSYSVHWPPELASCACANVLKSLITKGSISIGQLVHKEKQTIGADASTPGTVYVLSPLVTAHPEGTFSHWPDQLLFIGPFANL